MQQSQSRGADFISLVMLLGVLGVSCGPSALGSARSQGTHSSLVLSATAAATGIAPAIPATVPAYSSTGNKRGTPTLGQASRPQDKGPQGRGKTRQGSTGPAGRSKSGNQGKGTGRSGASKPVAITRTAEQVLLLRSARNAVALGRRNEAIDLFESYMVQLPADQEVRVEYAGVLVQQGRVALARQIYIKALSADPSSNLIRQNLVDVLIMSGEYAAAAKQLEQIVRDNIDDVAAAALLTRTYSWVKDLKRAQEVFDRYLRKLDPGNEADQQLLAPVLLDIQKPREAQPHLERLHTLHPKELVWASSLVYCYQLTGQTERAQRTVDDMAALEPEVIDQRIHLVDQLLSLRNYKLALEVIEQVLRAGTDNTMARLMAARIHLEAYDVRRARDGLEGLKAQLGTERRYSLAIAQLHQLTGEWLVAQTILESMLVQQPDDDEVRINLALLHREKGDLYRAKAELSKVSASSAYAARAQLEMATTLTSQGNAAVAASLCMKIMDQRPNDVEPVLALARAHMSMQNWQQAESVCQRFIQRHTSDKMAIAQARAALGKAQLLSGNAVQAVRTFQMSIEEPSIQDPETYYGLARAHARGTSAVGTEIARISAAVVASGGENRMRMELGKLAQANHDSNSAIEYLHNVLREQPSNTAARTLLGEAEILALKAGKKVNPVRTFSTILEKYPGNTRAHLGLARAYATQRKFKLAIPAYQAIIQQDSGYHFAKREYARALFWDQRLPESFAVYEELISTLPDERLAVDFFNQDLSGQGNRAISDYSVDTKFAEAVRLELDSKRWVDWKPALAADALERLLILEPTNQESLFDMAQIAHRRGLTHQAINRYDELLNVSGGHQEASVAIAGAQRQLLPHFDVTSGSETRKGRENQQDVNLSDMAESYTIADITFVLDEKDDYLGIGVGERSYDSGKDSNNAEVPELSASILRLFGSTRVSKSTILDGNVEFPRYGEDDQLGERVYYNIGLGYLSDSQIGVNFRMFSEPIAENFMTLRNDIHRQGGRLGVTSKITRKADLGGSLMIADYSDDNSRAELNIFAAYEFIAAPREFRVMFKADMLDNKFESEGLTDPNVKLEDDDTPYFSPKGYSVYSVQADWKHQLGEEWFTGAKDMYYRAGLRLASDSNSVGYTEFGLSAGWDVTDWMRVEAGFRLLRSSAIDISTGYGMMTIRWP